MSPRVVLLAVVALLVAGGGVAYWLDADQRARARAAALDEAEQALAVEDDPAKALRVATAALEEHPGDPDLQVVRGRAFAARGRHGDALEAFEQAEIGLVDPERLEEVGFFKARARLLRYLDAGDRGDFNVAEGDLEGFTGDLRFGGAAKVLLGLGLIRKGDARDHERARKLLTEGLAARGVEELVDVDRARDWLSRL
ncbi:MAG: hypothetical protein ACF8XB_06730 [Planctomycetota bacterium JB042]